MNHSLSKLFCTSVLISCAITSAYLTYLYMNELGAASVLDEVKDAILTGAVKPSQRGLKTAFNLPQEQIKQILIKLHEQDVLESWNNGGYRVKVI